MKLITTRWQIRKIWNFRMQVGKIQYSVANKQTPETRENDGFLKERK